MLLLSNLMDVTCFDKSLRSDIAEKIFNSNIKLAEFLWHVLLFITHEEIHNIKDTKIYVSLFSDAQW